MFEKIVKSTAPIILFLCCFLISLTAQNPNQLDGAPPPEPGPEPPIENPVLFYATIAVLAIGVFLYARYRMGGAAMKRAVKKTKRVSIQSFTNGQHAKVVGRVMPVDVPLIAPLSGKECVFYHLIIETIPTESAKGDANHGLMTPVNEKKSCPFFITDDTGEAKINPDGAEVFLQKDTKKKMDMFNEPDEQISRVLQQYGLAEQNSEAVNNLYRIKEGVLEIGEAVAITGQGNWQTINDTETLVFTHSPKTPLLLTDEPKTFR